MIKGTASHAEDMTNFRVHMIFANFMSQPNLRK